LRILILAAFSTVALTVPAGAQPYPADEEAVRDLPPAGEVREIGDSLGRVADAVMGVDVGPVVDAMDPQHRRYRRHGPQTIGDLASHGDPYARERIHASIGAATYGLEAALRQIAILTPVLRRSIEDTQRRIDDAMRHRDYGPDRGYDRGYDREQDRDWDREQAGDRDPDAESAPRPDERP
jgi:hypothetical protein